MHVDLEETASAQSFHAAVCVLGGGIAGLSLAMRLARQGIEVHVLEAGGLTPEPRSQDIYRTDMGAETHRGANDGRHRTFGGSSTQWGGQLLPFTPDIFRPVGGSPSVAWPIESADLEPFYRDAEAILGVDTLPFGADLLPALGHPETPHTPDITLRFSKWAPFGRRNLANTLGAEALTHASVTVFTHANVLAIRMADGAAAAGSVHVANYAGASFAFTADRFVVCMGTIESVRLLLGSPGVPNAHDQLGRYFHDHVSYHAARLLAPERDRAIKLLGPFLTEGTLHSAKIEASADLRGRLGLLAVMAHLVIVEPPDSGASAARNLLQSLQQGRLKEGLRKNLLPAVRGLGDIARLAFQARFRKRRAISPRAELRLNIDVEQAPDAQNRITLSESRVDALGTPCAVVHWRVQDAERDTAARFLPVLRRYLASAGLDPQEWFDTGKAAPMLDTYHMMGGLRMGVSAETSVVDRDLRVHGVANLYVASCAVFPSGSSSNPTFTMIALTLRLADHLATGLRAKA